MWKFDNHWPLAACLTLVLLLGYGPATLADDPTHDAFTYQGQLTQGGAPVTGPVNYAFRLYNAPAGGGQVGPEIEAIGFNAFDDEGRFTIDLEFGKGVFDGTPLWLEVRVNGAPLAPRQPIMPTPYSIRALNVAAVSDPALSGTYTNALNFSNAGNTFAGSFSGSFSGSGAGLTNLSAGSISSGTLSAAHAPSGGNWSLATSLNLANNAFVVNPANGHIGVGVANPLARLHIAEATSGFGLILPGLRVVENTDSPSVIGGSSGNTVSQDLYGATIGGGGQIANGWNNRVTGTGYFGTIAGGQNNEVSSLNSTIGGGGHNTVSASFSTVSGGSSNTAAGSSSTVGGGLNNLASGQSSIVGGGSSNLASNSSSTVGGGANNTASGVHSTVGGGQLNIASGFRSTVPGGLDNRAQGLYSFAAGRRAKADHEGAFVWGDNTDADFVSTANNQFLIRASGGVGIGTASPGALLHVMEGASGMGVILPGLRVFQNEFSPNVISGSSANTVATGIRGAAIGGGGSVSGPNRVHSDYATVGGGSLNQAGNAESPGAFSHATVGGGFNNAASGSNSTIGGGQHNSASAFYSTVGGGWNNSALANFSTVPGGENNRAQGQNSFAAGRRAKADHQGAFVWGDSTSADILSSTNNQATFRSVGGFRIFTNTALTAGVQVAAGASSWTTVSDRNMKENFAEVDGREVLERIAAMPITTWNYKSQDQSIRHMGPMAQDFWAAFELGEDELRINTVDIDGVALAAIQGLHQIVRENEMEIESLREEVVELRRLVSELLDREMKSR